MKHSDFARVTTALVAFGFLALQAVPTAAHAGVQTGDPLYFGNYNFTTGGSVTAYAEGSSTWQPFKTFCVQLEQTINVNNGPSSEYKVESIGYANDTPGNALSINAHIAWLYTSFLNGSLPNFTDDLTHEAALQYGIWHSLGYTDTQISNDGFGYYLNCGGAKDDYAAYGWTTTPGTWSGFGNVRVMEIETYGNNAPAQDLLCTVPSVPEPATMTLLALGGLALLKRRRRTA